MPVGFQLDAWNGVRITRTPAAARKRSTAALHFRSRSQIRAIQLLLAVLIGWLDRQEREILHISLQRIALRRQLRGRRLQLTDDDGRAVYSGP